MTGSEKPERDTESEADAGSAADDEPTEGGSEQGALISLRNSGHVTASDIFGFGAACKTKGAQLIAKAFADVLGTARDPERRLLLGLARNRIKEDQIVSSARAKAQAAEISAVSRAKISDIQDHRAIQGLELQEVLNPSEAGIRRMKARVITSEINRQRAIEAGFGAAMEDAELSGDSEDVSTLDPDFVTRWVADIQDVTVDKVFELYTRTLGAKATNRSPLSAASMSLLKSFNTEMAEAFNLFNRWYLMIGYFPADAYVNSDYLTHRQISLMEEIGLIKNSSNDYFDMRLFNIYMNRDSFQFGYFHAQYVFTQRGVDLARAIYERDDRWERGPLAGAEPSDAERMRIYIDLFEKATKSSYGPIDFKFKVGPSAEIGGIRWSKDFASSASIDELIAAIEQPGGKCDDFDREFLERVIPLAHVQPIPA